MALRPLNSTLLGRILIRFVILWGGGAIAFWLCVATPAKVLAPFLAPILLFLLWVLALIYGSRPEPRRREPAAGKATYGK